MDSHLPARPCALAARCMKACECTGASFDEIARRVAQGRTLEEVQVETGAGLLCTACVPDMRQALADAAALAGPRRAEATQEPTRVEPAA